MRTLALALTFYVLAMITLVGCTTLAGLAMDSISPAKGGINTELVVGDKEQVLGANQDVKASHVGKVVGNSDNSTAVASAQEVTVTNIDIPKWLIVVLILLATLVGWLFPRPAVWKAFINRNKQ